MRDAADQSESRLRIVVLAGGESAECAVSLRSGAAVAAALENAGHEVTRIDPAYAPLETVDWPHFDACFIALHGGAGEDGRIQEQLERLLVPYTGSNPAACRLAMSKSASKAKFVECDVPTLPHVLAKPTEVGPDLDVRVERLGYPVIVKPDCQGSSVGVIVVDSPAHLRAALAESAKFDDACLIEPLVLGREFTVAVLGRQALPLIEIITPERVFSYEAKYQSSLTEHAFDFELLDETRESIVSAAVAAADALDTAGLVRVDLMLAEDGRTWVLEVNTIPGMTERSLAPEAAARAGLEMPELCDTLIRQCLAARGAA